MLLLKEKRKLLCVRMTYSSMRDSVWSELKNAISNMGLTEHVKMKESILSMEFPNGSTIIMKGADSEERLLSISGITDCWIEEATELPLDIFEQLILRVRPNWCSSHFYISFNPINYDHWIRERVVENEELMQDGFAMHSVYTDNLFLPESYHKAMQEMKKSNPAKYSIFGEGKWGITGQLVYNNWEVKDLNVDDIFKQHSNIRQLFGLDFGFKADASAFVRILVDEDTKELFIVDEMYKQGMLNVDIADWLIKNGYHRCNITADSAEQKSIADLKRLGIPNVKPARKGKGSIAAGIALIDSFKIYVDSKCKNTIKELENYAYKKDKKTNRYTNIPIDSNNHALDALRYAMEELLGKQKKARTISKAVLGL